MKLKKKIHDQDLLAEFDHNFTTEDNRGGTLQLDTKDLKLFS